MREDEMLSPMLRRAVTSLREEPETRPEWIDAVVHAAAAQRIDDVGDRARRWSFRPSVAIAAGLAFAAAGAAATYTTMRARGPSTAAPVLTVANPTAKASVRFALVAPGAVRVTLVGDFNGWDPGALPMRRSASGETWEVEVGLAPGRYTYAFIVDGRLARDPAAAEAAHDDFGSPNSVLLVKGS